MVESANLASSAPGIVVLTGALAAAVGSDAAFEEQLAIDWNGPGALRTALRHGGWLVAGVVGRGRRDACQHRDGDGISVLLDGHLTDVVGPSDLPSAGCSDPAMIADLYRRFGTSFLPWLRGSFVGLIVDERADKVWLFNDRSGSRPLFVRRLRSGLAIAPRVRFLAKLDAADLRVRASAVGQFLLRGCFYANDTLFEGVEGMDQASLLALTRKDVEDGKYWSPKYAATDARKHGDLVEEFDDRLRTGVRRLLRVAHKPALLLSGGIDSRIMLAYLMQERGGELTAFSYAVAPTDGDDHIIARTLADKFGIRHETYNIRASDFASVAGKEVLAADGRVQMIDAPSSRWEYIAAQFDGMWIGDECFGWKGDAKSAEQALDLVGLWNLDEAWRAADWFKPRVKRQITQDIGGLTQDLLRASRHMEPNDIKDTLYYTQRMGNLLNGYHARRLNVCEQLRPLLDEDVVEFVARLPRDLRIDKAIARRLMRDKFPVLNDFPYAKKTSVPWRPPQFAEFMARDPVLSEFVLQGLTRRLDSRLGSMLDEARLHAFLVAVAGRQASPPLRGQWWVRLPGLWRFAADARDRVAPMQAILRLLNLNLYLASC